METEFAVSLGSQRWTLPADGDTITIGRGSNADIRLPSDDQISRIHARLDRTGTTWTLVDESRNGTALNGRRLASPTPLTNNDRIHIGRSVLTFHEPTTHAAGAAGGTPGESVTPGGPIGPGASGGFGGAGGPGVAAGAAGLADAGAAAGAAASAADGGGPAHAEPAAPEPGQVGPRAHHADPGDRDAPHPDGGSLFAPAASAPRPVEGPVPHGEDSGEPAGRADSGSPLAADVPGGQPGWEGQAGAEWPGDGMYDQVIGTEAEASPFAPEGGERLGWVDPEDAPASDAPWAAYPSADNPEPARSPWSGARKRPALTQPEGGQAHRSESAGWPESAFEQQERPVQPERRPEPVRRKPEPVRRKPEPVRRKPEPVRRKPEPVRRKPEPVRRKPEPTAEPRPGHVRLVRVLLVAAAVLGLGLVLNLVASFVTAGTGGTLRWLVPPAIALIAAMVVALTDGFSSEDRPAGGRLDVPVMIAIVAVLFGVGVGGFALTAGAEYVTGYVTGKESGADRLLKPVAKTGAGLTVTVENVTYTSHFTRIEVVVSNGSDQSLSFPHENVTFTAADGTSLKADGFRSEWPGSIAAGNVERGTVTFTGHLPEGLTTATLNLKSGDTTFAVPVGLSN
ncbi:FHA domain-containing protein [Kribbella turkmenica]|uniref:FHA domain-containing protein n=1 Tax=Kribbella turkmenica TaxID=2530375 RepID=A0A4R4WIC7_9ACTN|nr:FHA domain-containing protein [Kribbella turkmenica]TDD17197.1 FHA domain-containing protein [Kribbella turkmenica]